MKSKLVIVMGALLLTGLLVGIVGAQNDPVIQGGMLYDHWATVLKVDDPTDDHPLWATQSTNTRSGKDTWRCKECHGWDYQGVDGAYASGSHMTGFVGVYDSREKSTDELVDALKGGTNPDHDFSTVMDDEALTNLAMFMQSVMDYSQYIDYSTKAPIGGDAATGLVLFEDNCATCHGDEGTDLNFFTEEDPEYVGTLANANPQEFLHKTLHGQPGSKPRMVAGLENGWSMDQIVSILAYAQTLPTGTEAAEAPAETPAEEPAAQEGEGLEYTIQQDDWLSKLAEKYLNDLTAYPQIVEATNAKYAEDNSFAKITDPDVVEIGWKIWIPGGAESAASTMIKGREVDVEYRDTCGGCHGPHREGGTGPALIPARLTASDGLYINTILKGRPGSVMDVVWDYSEADAAIMLAFLKTEPSAESTQWTMEQAAATMEQLVDPATLPDAPTHSGNMDNLFLVTERENRGVAVIDGDTHTMLGKIPASYRAHGYTFDPTNERWAYNVGRDGWLFKFDLYTLQPVSKVRVGIDARGIAISDDGKQVIVGNYIPYSAMIVDTETMQPLHLLDTSAVENNEGKIVGSRICSVNDVAESIGPYFIIALKEGGQVWRIDYSDPSYPVEKVKQAGRILHEGFFNEDNTMFYEASQDDDWIIVIDVAKWEEVAKIVTGDKPHPGPGAMWSANGTWYGATPHINEGLVTIWDVANNDIVAQIPTSGPGLFIRAAENVQYVMADSVFGSEPNETYVIDKETFELVHTIKEGTQTLHPEFTHDGKYVYIADWQEDKVRVFETTPPFNKVAEIDGIVTPTGIFNTLRRAEPLGH